MALGLLFLAGCASEPASFHLTTDPRYEQAPVVVAIRSVLYVNAMACTYGHESRILPDGEGYGISIP